MKLDDYIDEQMKDPESAAEWHKLKSERERADVLPGFQRITPRGLTKEQVEEIADMTTEVAELTTRPEPAADAVEAMTKTLREAQEEFWRGKPDLNLIGWREAEEIEAGLIPALARAALQAAAVEPEPGLDELLDDVEAAFVSILWREDVGRHEVVMHGHSSAWFARGTGKTRTEALAAAVQQAKENGDG